MTMLEAFPQPKAPAIALARTGENAHLVERIVRDPAAFVADDAKASVRTTRALVVAVALGGGVFGAVVGAYRGGAQIAAVSVKMPLVLLATLAITTPAFVGLARAFGSKLAAREVVAVGLGACARFALVLAGLAPIVWLLEGWVSYPGGVLAITFACAIAGFAASGLLFRGLARGGANGHAAALASVVVYAIVGLQVSWLLRPFLGSPDARSVPIVRRVEGDPASAIGESLRGAIFRRDRRAPPPSRCDPAGDVSCD